MSIYTSIKAFLAQQPRYVSLLFKALVVVFFGAVLWYEVVQKADFDRLYSHFWHSLGQKNDHWLWLTLAFVPLNLAAETAKWFVLVRRVQAMSFFHAYKAVLAGVTFSLFFPNRVGEFGGRILFMKRKYAIKGTITTFVGNFAQQLILLSLGVCGFTYFLATIWQTEAWIVRIVVSLGLIIIGLLILIFLNLELVVPFFKKITFLYRFPRFLKNINILRQYAAADLFKTLFWAFIRYGIYTAQYYFMIRFFGINVDLAAGLAAIATIYFLQTSIPLPPIVGLMARGEVALKIWGLFQANELSILAATFTLWIINLIFPAFMGLIFIMTANLLNTLGYDKKKQL